MARNQERLMRAAVAGRGFTLIELMITLAIVGILAAIAYPSYRAQVVKTNRRAAASCLIEISQTMERQYSVNMSYSGATLPTGGCVSDTSASYTYSFAEDEPTVSTFKVLAAPSGAQAPEGVCGTLSLTNTGAKGQTSGSEAVCWS